MSTNLYFTIADFFKAPSLKDYKDLAPNGKTVQITLSCDEVSAIIAAYDHGINAIDQELVNHLEHAIATIKHAIWL